MAKGCNNASNKKSNSSKPYDASNSFVKKVASRVTGLLPQPSWLSSWFSTPNDTTERSDSTQSARYNRNDEDFEDCLDQPPPSKRLKLPDRNYESEIFMSSGTPTDGKKCAQEEIMDTSSVPGPSGQQRVPGGFVSSTPAEQDRKANGDDCSESAESTSGCSSLEPGVAQPAGRPSDSLPTPSRFLDDRFNYPSYLESPRTLFLERSNAPRSAGQNASRRKPSFCVTSLNSSLFGERSLNETMVNSPFYSGRTMYGGASSSPYRRSIGSSFSSSPANSDQMGRRTVKVKASTAQASVDSGMSETARRILATLEQFSTPLMDAKRIPVNSNPQPILASSNRKRTRQDTEEPRIVLNSPRSPQVSRKGVHWAGGAAGLPVNELTVPSTPGTLLVHRKERLTSAADDTLLRQKERLQDSTTAARRLANSVPASNIGLERTYTLRSEDEEPLSTKQSLKMKSELRTKNHRSSTSIDNEQPKPVNLPKISLPITSLPSFDIPLAKPPAPPPKALPTPPAASARLVAGAPAKDSKPSALLEATSTAAAAFTFASPIVVASDAKATSHVAFVFSKPDSVSEEELTDDSGWRPFSKPQSQSQSPLQSPLQSQSPSSGINFLSSVPGRADKSALKRKSVTVKENGADASVFSLKAPSELRTGSVMDILGKGAKDAKEVSVNGSVSLLDKFKPAAGTWECDQCLIRNKPDAARCVACMGPRPATDGKSTSNVSSAPAASGAPAAEGEPAAAASAPAAETPAKSDASFGAQFKLSGSDMWECSSCMVRNKSANSACVACGSAKASTTPQDGGKPAAVASAWGDKFKPAANTWECEACMVRNAADLNACQACTTKRPGAAPATTSTFPTSKATSLTSSWGDKFKKPEGSWSCCDCMITNTSASLKCVACGAKKPGADKEEAAATKTEPKFSFGIPPASSASTVAAPGSGFTFGSKPSDKTDDKPASGFKFGETMVSTPAANFTFGIPASISAPAPASTSAPPATSSSLFVTSTEKPVFSFGVPKQSSDAAPKTTDITANKTVSFNFGQTCSDTSEPARKRISTTDPVESSSLDTPKPEAPSSVFSQTVSSASETKTTPVGPTATGVVPTSKAAEADTLTKPTAVFSFSSNQTTGSPISLFKFGGDSGASDKAAAATAPSTAPSTDPAEAPKPSQEAKSIFGSGPTPAFAFGQPSSDTPKSATSVEVPPAAKPSFSFGQPRTDPPKAAEAPKPLSFGAVSDSGATPKPSFTFGQLSSEAAKPGDAAKPAVTFGATGDTASSAKPFSFNTTSDAAAKPLSGFGNPSGVSATPVFGAGITPFSSFGSTSAAGPVPTFGSSSTVTPSSGTAPTAIFGAPSTSAPVAAPTPAFGSTFGAPAPTDKTEAKPAGMFSFGSAKPAGGSPFTFNAAPVASITSGTPAPSVNGPTSQKAPEFLFGSQSTAPKTFTAFSAPNNAPAPAPAPAPSQGFNFGSNAPVFGAPASNAQSQQQQQPIFDSSNVPAFGAPAQPTFNTPAPAAQFNFAPNTQPSPSVFSFGGSQPPQNAAPGMPFSFSKPTPTPTPTPPTFNPNATPNFNFSSGGAVNFTATPSEVKSMPQRVIKKAMRRSTPR